MARKTELTHFELEGFAEIDEKLKQISTTDKAMEEKLRALIRQVTWDARQKIAGSVKTDNGDPRQAFRAVRNSVYKKVFGSQVNIASSKKAGARVAWNPERHPSNRGGNRRVRSSRTNDLNTYFGKDRGFILRFINFGTKDRSIKFKSDSSREKVNRGSRGGDVSKYGKTTNTGSRGSIAARNWFGPAGRASMQQAAEHLSQLIDEEIAKQFNA